MARKTTRTTPLFFQSKPFCFSCLYLTSMLILSFYLAVSPSSKCFIILKSSRFVPLQSPLFSYPSSYGEHKHSLPTLRTSCSSPVFFSDYRRVFNEIDELSRNSTTFGSDNVRYMQQRNRSDDDDDGRSSFGGNFSIDERLSFFDHPRSKSELPCGFLQPFPVHFDDRIAMENCYGLVVLSAIFANHDKIRQPSGLGSRTLESVCFFMFIDDTTLTSLQSNAIIPPQPPSNQIYYTVGAWRLVIVDTDKPYPNNPAMNGVIPKYLVHRLFPNAKYSVWLDAKLQLAVDPLLLVHSLLMKEGVDMAISKHPFFVHTMEEAMATARWRKWVDVDGLRMQMESYCEHGLKPWSKRKLPYPSDVPDTAMILRRHGENSALFSCLMFNELNAYNHRDQLAFAFVRDKMKKPNKIKINMFDAEVFEQTVREFRHNIHHPTSSSKGTIINNTGKNNEPEKEKNITVPPTRRSEFRRAKLEHGSDFTRNLGLGKCKRYFEEMWGDD